MEKTVNLILPNAGEGQEAPDDSRPQRWRVRADRRMLHRRQTGRVSALLLLVVSAAIFSVLRRTLGGASRASSEIPKAPETDNEFLSEAREHQGHEPYDLLKGGGHLFPTIHHAPTRTMLFEAMRFALESQRARKGFSARFVAADGEGVQVQVDAQLRTSELLAGYLEAAVNGSIGEAHELGGSSSARTFSVFSFTGKGRIDFSVRATASDSTSVKQRKQRRTADSAVGTD